MELKYKGALFRNPYVLVTDDQIFEQGLEEPISITYRNPFFKWLIVFLYSYIDQSIYDCGRKLNERQPTKMSQA